MVEHITNGSKEIGPSSILRRRSMIAGVGALAAGLVAAKAAQPVSASDGALQMGADNTATAETHISGSVNSPNKLLHLSQNGTGSALEAYGLGGIGVLGWSLSSHGVNGQTNIGDGTHAGVTGTAAPGGNGVLGECDGNVNSYGVWGKSDIGVGVRGQAASSGTGVYGSSPTGMAVRGDAAGANASGVYGYNSGTGIGTSGYAPGGIGVYGVTNASSQYGVLGTTTAANSTAIAGIATQNGSSAFSGGTANPNAFGAVFQGTVLVQGKLVVSDPSYKSGAIAHPDGTHRLVYCVESPESWIEDVGKGTLTGGKGAVRFDADFTAVTHTDDYRVFLTAHGDSKGLYVTNENASGFEVREQQGGTSSLTFSWRVMVKAKSSVKQERLGKFTMPNIPLPDAAKLPKPPEVPEVKKK